MYSHQDTPADHGALRVSRATHTTSCRGDMERFFSGDECRAEAEAGAGAEAAVTSLALPAGSVVLMDSRLLHGGGAHTARLAAQGGGEGDGDGAGGAAAARVVFYFSFVSSRTASASYLPIGSTYALRGEPGRTHPSPPPRTLSLAPSP